MSIAFWSIKLEAGKPQEVAIPEGYVLNVQSAALEIIKDTPNTALVLKVITKDIQDNTLESVIGTLRPLTADQISLGACYSLDISILHKL